jgi:hypothetical protein
MGKIILEFDSIEESVEAKNALDGSKWKIAIDQYVLWKGTMLVCLEIMKRLMKNTKCV